MSGRRALRVLAVDMGATSVRVVAVDVGTEPPDMQVLHRHPHAPVRAPDGSLRWEWDRIVAEVRRALEAATTWGPFASLGIDTWGVDYGLVDGDGDLLSPPYCYRDGRTEGWREVADRLGAGHLYRTTGIQLMAINTIFQLAVHDRAELAVAEQLMMLPELMAHELTGAVTGERTSAGTTGLVDLSTGTWSDELVDAIGIERVLLPRIAAPGTKVGTWSGVPVHLVAGHDTASAVAALPPAPGARPAFISAGTWMLVGAERPEPDVSDAAREGNFSNEPAAFGGVRFLKNVMGLWMLERCLAEWGDPPLEPLLGDAGGVRRGPVVDATDERFLAPASMEGELRAAARMHRRAGRADVVRCIVDSLAAAAASVIRELDGFLDGPVTDIRLIGGGARNPLLARLIEEACGRPVHVGAPEATALGNALVQGVALGRWRDIDDARASLAEL